MQSRTSGGFDEENDKDKEEIGKAIYDLRKTSKTFNALFEALHNSKSVFKVSNGQLAGAEGIFYKAQTMIDDIDENGNPVSKNDIGLPSQKENPHTGGDIIFDLNEIKSNGINIKDVTPEEFGHAYQYLNYTEGSFDNYSNIPAGGNYEYEGKLISGIIKNEAGIRFKPKSLTANSWATNRAERNGINFNIRNYSKGLQKWFNRDDNFYRTFYNRSINVSQLPTALLKLKKK